MNRQRIVRNTVLSMTCTVLLCWAAADLGGIPPMADAEAVVGRPVTPASYAGVARRTSRRTVRRNIAYGTRAYSLPVGCATLPVAGITYYNCDGAYYQPQYQGTTVIYVVVPAP